MNRKFFLSGVIVSKLMNLKDVSVIELASRLNKTQQAVSQIRRRDIIKDADAIKILSAFGLSFEEVENMDDEGIFQEKKYNSHLTKKPEIELLNELFAKTESFFRETTEKQGERIAYLEDSLKSKDIQINTLIGLLGASK